MTIDSDHNQWVDNPTGKISKGAFCNTCARFNNRPTAVSVILVQTNRILLLKRAQKPGKGDWDIPGGYLDWDETLEEGAIRELYEETNLKVDLKDLKFHSYFSNPDNVAENQVIEMYYIATKYSGEIKLQEEEVDSYRWFGLDELPENVAFDHLEVLNKLKI